MVGMLLGQSASGNPPAIPQLLRGHDFDSTRTQLTPEQIVMPGIDRPTEIPYQVDPEAFLKSVLGGPFNAKVASEPANKNVLCSAILQIPSQSSRWSIAFRVPVVAKGTIRIDRRVHRFSNDGGGSCPRDRRVQVGARSSAHAVIRPKGLFMAVEFDPLKGAPASVV